jgi:hypothetical protein
MALPRWNRARFLLLFAAMSIAGLLLSGLLRSARAAEGALLPNLVANSPTGQEYQGVENEAHEKQLLLRFNGYIQNKGPGTMDIRGERAAPKVAKSTEEQVERDREHNAETLSVPQQEELANPPMNTIQREFFTPTAEEDKEREERHEEKEANIERPHAGEPSEAKLIYSSADLHDHWHLQHVARYSLWSSAKSAEVAPAQKVGFCLDDSERVEPTGPAKAVYSDSVAPYRDFCQYLKPDTTTLFEGVSVGWRDLYSSNLALQWVDVSSVLPGEYWLREDVNPEGVVKEVSEPNLPAYATVATIIPGYDATSQETGTELGDPVPITLTATKWVDPHSSTTHAPTPGAAEYKIIEGPHHGTLGTLSENHVTYTPAAGFSGADSFSFSAKDSTSPYPKGTAAVATVSIVVGPAASSPGVAITAAPSAMVAGTSATATATLSDDPGPIVWSVSDGGSVTSAGAAHESATLTAPAAPGTILVTASLADHPSVFATREITILPAPAPEPTPGMPTSEPAPHAPALARPRAMLAGRKLVISDTPSVAGGLRLTAWLGKLDLGSCVGVSPANLPFTCRIKLGRRISLHAKIRVVARLRIGHTVTVEQLGPERVPEMKMVPAGSLAHASNARGMYWCSPSTLIATLQSR